MKIYRQRFFIILDFKKKESGLDWVKITLVHLKMMNLLFFDSNSFGKHVLKSKKRFHFLNDKLQEGVKEGIYKLNDKDVETEKECHKYGSIIGLRFSVKDESKRKRTYWCC